MEKIRETILRLHTEVMHKQGIEKESTPELEIRPRNGITSESIVTILLGIEDELSIELDNYLARIRECKTIGELVDIVTEAYKNSK